MFKKMIVLKVHFTQLAPKFSDQVSIHQRSITCVFKDLSIVSHFTGQNEYTLNGVDCVTDSYIFQNI